MRIDNRLTHTYVGSYPADAARTIERLPPATAAPLIAGLETPLAALLLRHMMPAAAAACLTRCPQTTASRLLKELPGASAARVLEAMALDPAGEAALAEAGDLRALLPPYAPDRVGYHMQPLHFVLPDDITVAEALRRARQGDARPDCTVYLVDRSSYALRGMVHLPVLLRSSQADALRSIMGPAPAVLPARTLIDDARQHHAWDDQRRLPVVDERGTLLGIISYRAMLVDARDGAARSERLHVLDTVIDVAELYWVALASAADALLRHPAADRGPGPQREPRRGA